MNNMKRKININVTHSSMPNFDKYIYEICDLWDMVTQRKGETQ